MQPDLIVLHFTAMAQCQAALERLCDPKTNVSSHYLISEKGEVFHLVKEDMRAWHAGEGQWRGQQDVNSRSIGIELDNTGKTPFSHPLMQSLEGLLQDIMDRWSIPPHGVIGHSDMAPARKFDPGRRFDWRRLARAGLSIWPQPGPEDADFATSAARFGYDMRHGEQIILHAFRQRFRPMMAEADTTADIVDRAMAADLAHRFGCA